MDDEFLEMVEEMPEEKPLQRPAPSMMALRPWQRFVLALLLFLDVAFIGLLVLVMLGRMQF